MSYGRRSGKETEISSETQEESSSSYLGLLLKIVGHLPKRPRFLTRVALGALAVVGTLAYGGIKLAAHPLDWSILGWPLRQHDVVNTVTDDRFKGPMWWVTNDPSPHKAFQTKKIVLHGTREFTGEYENLDNGHRGYVHGYERDGVIALVLAVDDVNIPGIDVVVFRPVQSTAQSEPAYFVGFETGPDCDCKGYRVSNAPITSVAGVLWPSPSPPPYITGAVFDKKPEVPEPFYTPAEVENKLNRQAVK
jgi:hypothetical protein